MRKNCETCKHDDRLGKPICDKCYNTSDAPTKWEPAEHYKPATNADRIRAMNDEELANMLTDFSNNSGWVTETGRKICYERHIEWLQSPAEKEGE